MGLQLMGLLPMHFFVSLSMFIVVLIKNVYIVAIFKSFIQKLTNYKVSLKKILKIVIPYMIDFVVTLDIICMTKGP